MDIYVCVKCERSFKTNDENAETCEKCSKQECFTDHTGTIDLSDVPCEFEIQDYEDNGMCYRCGAPPYVDCNCD